MECIKAIFLDKDQFYKECYMNKSKYLFSCPKVIGGTLIWVYNYKLLSFYEVVCWKDRRTLKALVNVLVKITFIIGLLFYECASVSFVSLWT